MKRGDAAGHERKPGFLGALVSDRFVVSSGAIGVATVLSGLLAYAFQILVGRFLGAEAYGEFSALFGLLAFLVYLTSAVTTMEARGVASASESPGKIASLLKFYYRRMAALGILFAFGFAVLSGVIADWLHITDVSLVWFLPPCVVGSFLLAVAQGGLQGLKQFRLLAMNFLLNSGVRLAAGLGLVVVGLSLWGAFGGALLGIVVASAIGTYQIRHHLRRDAAEDPGIALPSAFAGPTLVATLFSSIPTNIDVVAIQHLLPGTDAGVFAATAVFGRITYFVPAGIILVFFPMLLSEGASAMSTTGLLRKALLLAVGVASAFGLVVVGLGDPIVHVLFGASYVATTTILPMYEATMVVFSAAMILAYYHLAVGNPRPIYWATAAIVAGIAALWSVPVTLAVAVDILFGAHVVAFAILSAYTVVVVRDHRAANRVPLVESHQGRSGP